MVRGAQSLSGLWGRSEKKVDEAMTAENRMQTPEELALVEAGLDRTQAVAWPRDSYQDRTGMTPTRRSPLPEGA